MKSDPTITARRTAFAALLVAFGFVGGWRTTAGAQTISAAAPLAPAAFPSTDVRYGGVLAESYGHYHLGTAERGTIAPPGGWSGYGFPVSTYRWGWFGASRYFPTVLWHRGYMGDQKRWAYRRGY